MLIGLDFDNTIVCYDRAIVKLAEEIPGLPKDLPRTKLSLRDHLRQTGREGEWTTFQGTLYGPGMRYADPFDGAISTMQELVADGHQLVIVSHRSLHPYAGPQYNLHAAACNWVAERLQTRGLFQGVNANNAVNFLETREAKLATITRLGCAAFLDDLPEILDAPEFPVETTGILFDPSGELPDEKRNLRIHAWTQMPTLLVQFR
jgi:hypothetical protein